MRFHMMTPEIVNAGEEGSVWDRTEPEESRCRRSMNVPKGSLSVLCSNSMLYYVSGSADALSLL